MPFPTPCVNTTNTSDISPDLKPFLVGSSTSLARSRPFPQSLRSPVLSLSIDVRSGKPVATVAADDGSSLGYKQRIFRPHQIKLLVLFVRSVLFLLASWLHLRQPPSARRTRNALPTVSRSDGSMKMIGTHATVTYCLLSHAPLLLWQCLEDVRRRH